MSKEKTNSDTIYEIGDIITSNRDGDSRRWVVVRVFKTVLWVKPIIDSCVLADTIYKGIRKDMFKIIGREKQK